MQQWILAIVSFVFFLISGPAIAAEKPCCIFPTIEAPTASYIEPPRMFSSPRSGGRLHAACDIYQSSADQPVNAIEEGKVVRAHYAFYEGTYAIEVKHKSGFIVRYGEVTGKIPDGVKKNAKVKWNQLLGYVGKVNSGCCEPMLHFELYKGTAIGNLSQPKRKPYHRRRDLLDPTKRLQTWQKLTFPIPFPFPIPRVNELPRAEMSNHPSVSEKRSFETLLSAMIRFYKSGTPLDLMTYLDQSQFAPQLTVDENADTGTLTFVQSSSEEFSAHHFHAQYFRDLSNEDYVQHISFVLRPKTASMSQVMTSLSRFPMLGPPQRITSDFREWDLGDGYTLWVKRLNAEDLLNDPFHTYTENDIGSIQIAVELNPEI